VRLKNGETHAADAVLANADLPYVYEHLLPPNGRVKKLHEKRFSCSVISFFWGMKRQFTELPPHTLFLSDDYRRNFEIIDRELGLAPDSSLYIHAPARLDPSVSPPGKDTVVGIVPVGHMSRNGSQDWAALRESAREQIFQRLRSVGISDFADQIEFEINFTPLSWRKRYNLIKGATHGLCHNLTQLGIFRPDFEDHHYPSLYFTGASTRPGTGMPTAMVSGRHAAHRILG
jgi:phytoene desaturase